MRFGRELSVFQKEPPLKQKTSASQNGATASIVIQCERGKLTAI